MKKYYTLITVLVCLLMSGTINAENQVKDTRVWVSPSKNRVVFDLTQAPKYSVFSLKNPDRLVVDLKETEYDPQTLKKLSYQKDLIKNIRSGIRKQKDVRIVFDLNNEVSFNHFTLKPHDQYQHRLVVDLSNSPIAGAKKLQVVKSVPQKKQKLRDIVVAIDAGHGGEDPGAIGRKGNYEKTVVLKIAKELEKLIKSESGMRPLMIRTGDYYVPLRERTRKARKHKADLFISIHADSFHNSKVQGASVYALSQRGATSEAARMLARRENKSDLIGGIGGSVELNDKDAVLAKVLLDLSQTAAINASLNFGGIVLNQLNQVTELHKFSVEKANFMVLRSPDIPSLLIETGFISNPFEEKQLSNKRHRKRLARSIMKSIQSYFKNYPPPGTHWHAELKGEESSKLSSIN